MTPRPFKIDIDDTRLRDLSERLERTRWPDASPADAWAEGTDLTFLRRLVEYWRTDFDWRAREAELNEIPQFVTDLDGSPTHFIHQRGAGPDPMPLLVGHGWPNTPFDLRRLIPLLTDPAAHGADPRDAFHVVAPSLPGYGFSSAPTRPGVGPERVAHVWDELMTGLGYARYGVQSGDWGAAVAIWLGTHYAQRIAGLHLNFLPGLFQPPPGDGQPAFTAEERAFVDRLSAWFDEQGGYHRLQSTRPQTPAYALNDSPAGLAAWIVEKLRGWSDCAGDVERVFTLDDILTTVSLYWFTESIGSSMRFYYENRAHPNHVEACTRIEPPLGFAAFPAEINPPRSWLERAFNLTRYSDMPHGNHFGAWEAPDALARDIRAHFRPLRP